MTHVNTNKKTIYVGGLAEDVDEKMVKAALIPFGEITEVQIPLDYQTSKHRGFAFVEFESAEDAAAAIDNMNESELCGRTLRVNLAKPLKITPNSSRPVWQNDEWQQLYAGKSLSKEGGEGGAETETGKDDGKTPQATEGTLLFRTSIYLFRNTCYKVLFPLRRKLNKSHKNWNRKAGKFNTEYSTLYLRQQI